jgi:hypothetical protein
MVAKSRAWDRVYEWSNYRLASSRLNARKSACEDVLDPFEIGDDWFHLELVGFQIVPNPELPTGVQTSIRDTVDRLRLDDFRKERETGALWYWDHEISLRTLTRESPFVARELRRQGRLNPGDM